MTRWTLALASLGALALPAAAGAHVTLQPKEAPAGSFVRLDVRVPNERDDKGTTKVVVQFPPGIAFASYEPLRGWEVTVKRRKAATPIDVHGESIPEEIDTVTFEGGVVPPGAFQDFGLSVRTPDQAGAATFKATQTYQGGEVVRWIGPAGADEPAPTVTFTAAADGRGAAAAPAGAEAAEDDEDGDGLALAGLVVGGLGLLAGGTALVRGRRGDARPAIPYVGQ